MNEYKVIFHFHDYAFPQASHVKIQYAFADNKFAGMVLAARLLKMEQARNVNDISVYIKTANGDWAYCE